MATINCTVIQVFSYVYIFVFYVNLFNSSLHVAVMSKYVHVVSELFLFDFVLKMDTHRYIYIATTGSFQHGLDILLNDFLTLCEMRSMLLNCSS